MAPSTYSLRNDVKLVFQQPLAFGLQSAEHGDVADSYSKDLQWCRRAVDAAKLGIRITDGLQSPTSLLLPDGWPKNAPLFGEMPMLL